MIEPHAPKTARVTEEELQEAEGYSGSLLAKFAGEIIKLRTKLEIARSAQTDLTSEVFSEKRKHEQSLAAGKFREDRITFLESQNKKLDELESEIRELRESIKVYQSAAEGLLRQTRDLNADNARLLKQLEQVLASLYPIVPAAIARLCDEKLDRSGALLGRVRERCSEGERR